MLVVTNDTFTFMVPDSVAQRCGTLRRVGDDAAGDPVPLANVSSTSMARVVQYYTKLAEFERLDSASSASTWSARFFETMPRLELYRVMEAANYLDAGAMLDDACSFVAGLIRGRTPDEIRDIFLLPRDMTSDEARRKAAEFEWALK